MIKKIHYVWLGGNYPPPSVKYCVNTWRKFCPDYEIVEWSEKNFDIDSFVWVREAVANKKYAFASDFIRLYVLEKYGGIYVDTDVECMKPVEGILDADFVCGIENFHYGTSGMDGVDEDGIDRKTGKKVGGFGINAGFIYSEPHAPVLQEILRKWYENGNKHFINEDGTMNQMIIDGVLMNALHSLGLKFRDFSQRLDGGIHVYGSDVISIQQSRNANTVVMHWYDQSWNNESYGFFIRMKCYVKRNFPRLYRWAKGLSGR